MSPLTLIQSNVDKHLIRTYKGLNAYFKDLYCQVFTVGVRSLTLSWFDSELSSSTVFPYITNWCYYHYKVCPFNHQQSSTADFG